MKLTKNQIFIIIAVVAVIGVGWFLLSKFSKNGNKPVPVALKVWGVADRAVMDTLSARYSAYRPNVTVTYTQIPADGYDQAVIDAMAAGQGPDVFMMKNYAVARNAKFLTPVPDAQFTLSSLDGLFPTTVSSDAVVAGKIYFLPLDLNTLALYYNKDYFDQAGIAFPPATWQDFQSDVNRLKKLNDANQVIRAGAAIGGSGKTISEFLDILGLLMMQNGAQMTDAAKTTAMFAQGGGEGQKALNFYLQFANPTSDYFTWSDAQVDSKDSFAQGNTAMIFGYRETAAAIRQKSPFLNFRVAAVPQTSSDASLSFPSYWGLGVSRQSPASGWAWDYTIFATTNQVAVAEYNKNSQTTPALRTLIASSSASTDPTEQIFARQALSARSWFVGDWQKATDIFNSMLADIFGGRITSDRGLRQAQDQMSQVIKTINQ